MPKQLTVRGVSDELGSRLEEIARSNDQSVNTTVLRLLEVAVGVSDRKRRLLELATWTVEDAAEFDNALASQRVVDEDLWG